MIEGSGRRRWVAVASAVALAAVIVGTSGLGGVSARPSIVLGQAVQAVPSVAETVGSGQSSHPSVSGDGRFVTFQALPGNGDPAVAAADARTSTVYLTDRDGGSTVELTTVPEGLRAGNSINPVISGDGCNVVVVTEMALDVFRDDDTGDRWDVYRLRLPHCGGAGGAWELVSTTTDGSGLARDDVSVIDPPAVSRSGTLIAYTHPATHLIEVDGVTAISLVDLERPINDPARSTTVAGMPIS